MKIVPSSASLTKIEAQMIIVPVAEHVVAQQPSKRTKSPARAKKGGAPTLESLGLDHHTRDELLALDTAAKKQLTKALHRLESVSLKEGKRTDLPLFHLSREESITIRLSGVKSGAMKGSELHCWRRVGGDAVQSAKKHRVKHVAILLTMVNEERLGAVVQAITEGITLANYSFDRFKAAAPLKKSKAASADEAKGGVEKISLLLEDTTVTRLAIKRGEVIGRSVLHARDLINCPPNVVTPTTLADDAKKIATQSKGRVKATIFGATALKKMGAGSLLAVAAGSDEEPYLIHLHYQPKKRSKSTKTVAIVGKGITFDSGGLSIKPGKGMEEMKADMSGAAAALGIMKGVSELSTDSPLEHELHILVPTCENMINGKATRPGDIVTAMNGKTIEILNTDAEGRLILADALSYAEKFKPEIVIDIATLTGACIVALGGEYAGLFSNNDALKDAVMKLGDESGERFWPLPLAQEYRPSIDSTVAHLKNIAASGPGAIVAALFLQEFVPSGCAWAHLDIAGPAFQSRTTEVLSQGGTGFSIGTLLSLLYSEELAKIESTK